MRTGAQPPRRPLGRPAVERGRLGPSARRRWPEGSAGLAKGTTDRWDDRGRGGNGSAPGLFRGLAHTHRASTVPDGVAQAVGWGLREGLFDGLAGISAGDNRSDCRESRHGLAK